MNGLPLPRPEQKLLLPAVLPFFPFMQWRRGAHPSPLEKGLPPLASSILLLFFFLFLFPLSLDVVGLASAFFFLRELPSGSFLWWRQGKAEGREQVWGERREEEGQGERGAEKEGSEGAQCRRERQQQQQQLPCPSSALALSSAACLSLPLSPRTQGEHTSPLSPPPHTPPAHSTSTSVPVCWYPCPSGLQPATFPALLFCLCATSASGEGREP